MTDISPSNLEMTDAFSENPKAMEFRSFEMNDIETVRPPRNLKSDAAALRRFDDEASTEEQKNNAVAVGVRVMHEAVDTGWKFSDEELDWYDEDIVKIAQIVVAHARFAKRIREQEFPALGVTFQKIFDGKYKPPTETNATEQAK